MNETAYFPGLEGVIAGETAISTVGDGLRYRGYPIDQLAEHSTFLEVAWLLLYGELPSQEELADFISVLADAPDLPDPLVEFLGSLPMNVPPMDMLRTGISALAHFETPIDPNEPQQNILLLTHLLAQVPMLLSLYTTARHGEPPRERSSDRSYLGNLLYLLTGEEPDDFQECCMDVSLILYAEHEFNASTFSGRVVVSTGSDLFSGLTAAVGALKGPLHGGANERVMEVLKEVGTPGNAERWVKDALARKQRIMGFGHRVYKTGDPRAKILDLYCRELAEQMGRTDLEEIASTIERIVLEEKGLHPNLDWPAARLYAYLGLDVELYTPLFVLSRLTGWTAHIIEQMQHNRLIRPRSRYIGVPPRDYVSLAKRD